MVETNTWVDSPGWKASGSYRKCPRNTTTNQDWPQWLPTRQKVNLDHFEAF